MSDKPLVFHKMSPKDELNEIYWSTGQTPGSGRDIGNIKKKYPHAHLQRDDCKIATMLDKIFSDDPHTIDVILKGTEFEIKVWEQLTKIRRGTTVSYEEVAKAIGNLKAIRAISRTIGRNPILILIPCHRVIRKRGDIGQYGGGMHNKIKLLRLEKAI
ncbi:unnamed protein product [Callosobruchus maculatus]|uniref:Methylated-DNA--protein-cysteine methyltransferase n=1 Tax=Callosobruchus maculatus TaxID=64391 RepID=A0A653CJS6_CALMS|nr:unnamed protein product [Callosobruchus maculatus]